MVAEGKKSALARHLAGGGLVGVMMWLDALFQLLLHGVRHCAIVDATVAETDAVSCKCNAKRRFVERTASNALHTLVQVRSQDLSERETRWANVGPSRWGSVRDRKI